MNIPALMQHFCDAFWEYRVSTNEVFLHHDTMNPELCNRWISYQKINQLYQETYVYFLDVEIWKRCMTPEALQEFYSRNEDEHHFYLRFEHTKKGLELHEIYVQKADQDRLILSSRDIRDVQRSSVIAQAVMPEFDYVCRIDLTDGSYVLYYSDENKTVVPQNASDNYERIMEEYNRLYVIPEEAETLTGQMYLDVVKSKLAHSKEYILYATMQDKDSLSYKKLRFSYENEGKTYLLLTRTDVGALIGERKLRERERAKRLEYLENMPVAFCSIKVLLDKEGTPFDFQFTYCNRAHEELEGVKPGELIGKNFYEFFQETDPKWLKYYYETAYQGIPHKIRSYSPEINKFLMIYTFRSEPGHCECVLLDESEQHFLNQELEYSHETMKHILEITTDQVFQYLPERNEVILLGRGTIPDQVMTEDSLNRKLMAENLLHPNFWEDLTAAFQKIRHGEHNISFVAQARLCQETPWKWFQITMFDFQDGYTHERKVFGFLKNIDEFRSREEILQKKAEQDSLTGVLNAGTGKQRISEIVENKLRYSNSYRAMFVMDLDNFKTVNDTMGHLVGDKMLIEFAQILRKSFRSEDVIYRLGGDEFVVFVENLHNAERSVQAIAHRLMLHIAESRSNHPLLSCSIGIFVTNQNHSFEEYYRLADRALYEAKQLGKGCFHIISDAETKQPSKSHESL